jgi:hypothetical protein
MVSIIATLSTTKTPLFNRFGAHAHTDQAVRDLKNNESSKATLGATTSCPTRTVTAERLQEWAGHFYVWPGKYKNAATRDQASQFRRDA